MSGMFLSYKAEDRPRIKPLVGALEADGLNIWWDCNIPAGSRWRENIQEHLDAADCVVVVWSKKSVGPGGHFVRDEATHAQRRETYLPVRIDRVDPPLGFGEVQVIGLEGWKGDRADERYQTLLAAIRAIAAGEKPHLDPAVEPDGISRRAALGGAGAFAVLAAAAGGYQLMKPREARAASIAVLPFANLSGDPRQDYFSQGIAEELRTALAQLDGLKVAGRISSEAVRGEDAATVARRLRVGNILTGSVRRAPGVVRITSQLLDGRNGLERWSASYDRPEGNVLGIQTEIAENVVAALSLELGHGGAEALTAGGTSDEQAHDLYLRAVTRAQNDDSEEGLNESNRMLDGALARDPRFAKAYAAKSRNLSYLADVGHTPAEISAGYSAAIAAAERAIALSPRLAEAYAALADGLYGQRRISRAADTVAQALSFAPNDLQLLQAAVVTYVAAAQTQRAVTFADRMIEIDPLNPLSHRRRYYALFYDRQFDAALAETRVTLKLAPALVIPPYFAALSLIMTGRAKEAQKHLDSMPPDLTVRLAGDAIVAAKLGDRAGSDRKLKELTKLYGDAASYQFAEVYAQRGEKERAFNALERGFDVSDPGLNTLAVDPLFDPIRADPRFAEMVKRVDVLG